MDCENNTAVFGETEQNFTPLETGMYAVTITSNGCTETSDCFPVNTVGIEQLNQNNWQVYPNPATDKLNVIIETPEVIQITEVSGKIVSVEHLQTGKNTIDVSSFATGVYFIQSKTGREHVKFVKNN